MWYFYQYNCYTQQSKLRVWAVRRREAPGKGTVSPLHSSLPSCHSVPPDLSVLTWGPPVLHSPFEGGNVNWGCLWLSDWLREAPAARELHSASSAWHWASLCPRSRRRLQQQIAIRSQGPMGEYQWWGQQLHPRWEKYQPGSGIPYVSANHVPGWGWCWG